MEDGQRQKMADQSLLGVIFLCSFLKGSGQTYLSVFISDGESVSLPCVDAPTDCTTTRWMYNRERSGTVDLYIEGMKNNDIERHERLSLGSDCSLNIYKATTEDHGSYACRKHLNTTTTHTDDCVNLNVLHVSPSSTQTEIRPGRSFSLSCQLYVYEYSCVKGMNLVWKNESDVDLQSDSRYQISFSRERCTSSLTTTLLDEDHNTEWRCEITKGAEVKTSVRYTVTLDNKTLSGFSIRVILLVIEMAVFTPPTVILLLIVCERRADNRRRGQDTQRNNTE